MARAEQVLFAGIDEGILVFAICALLRALSKRKTAGLLLRPQTCFLSGRWYYPIKRLALGVLSKAPSITIATISPFSVDPRYAEIATTGVYDPQYWDAHDGLRLREPRTTPLSANFRELAAGRPIVCALGLLNETKGLGFLLRALEASPEICRGTYVICAGQVHRGAEPLVARLKEAGVTVWDRRISDDELESLYGISDAVWACYTPEYDQASGIFGRAIQFGVPPIVREGSIVATFARLHGLHHVPVQFGDVADLSKALGGIGRERRSAARMVAPTGLIAEWRVDFQRKLMRALV